MEPTTHETAYVIHDFNATNEDEISLKAGEPVLVIEKDDLYNDGWWQGQNVRGEIGLFPMNFITLIDPLSPMDSEKQNSNTTQQSAKTIWSPTATNGSASPANHNPYFPSISDQNVVDESRGEAELSKQLNNALNLNSPKDPGTKQALESNYSAPKPESNLKNATINPNVDSLKYRDIGKQPSAPRRSMHRQSEAFTTSNSKLLGNGQPPYLWDVSTVCEWLATINLEKFAPRFQQHEIDGETLLALNLDTLREIGITEFGKRFNVNNAITHLKRQYGLLSESESNASTPVNQTPGSINGSPQNHKSTNNHKSSSNSNLTSQPSLNNHKAKNGQEMNRHFEGEFSSPLEVGKNSGSHNNTYPEEPLFNEASNFVTEKSSIEKWLQSTPGYHPVDDIPNHQEPPVASREINSFTDSDENFTDSQEDEDIPDAPVGPPPPNHSAPPPSYHSEAEPQRPPIKKQVSFSVQNEDFSTIRSDRSRPPPPDPELVHSYKPPSVHTKNGGIPTTMSYDIDSARPPTPPQNLDTVLIAGWLRKQGKTCKLWNDRWCVLKGHRLLLYYSDKEKKAKGEIDLRGYKPIPDPTINPGKYCFKLVHPQNKALYFAAELKEEAQDWIKALMKVAINRDVSAPVVTSCTVNTVPLHVARKLAPRPPSSVFTAKDEMDNDLPH